MSQPATPQSGRRVFLQGVAGGAIATAANVARAQQRDDKVVVGLIGAGGMGSFHLRQLSARKDVQVAWVSDVDQQRLAKASELVASIQGKKPQTTTDLRRILDDRNVDAVFIATPDHWHAPAAILGLKAGKHVYVEKPCCHNIREGRWMAEEVKRSGKLLQVGTQSRSTDMVREAIQRLKEGEIGEILVAKAWNSQRRGTIGKTKPSRAPEHLDFDLWLGPVPEVEYRSNMLHAIWRWWYDFGCGDIGNDGVHDLDVATWGLGVETHPSTATCLGGTYFFDDDMQFPDTQYAAFEYPGKRTRQLIYEQRIWSPYVQEGYENGAAFYGTNGLLILGHTVGWRLYGPRNKLIAQREGRADLVAHHQNFFDCVRGKTKQLNADIEVGHRSAAVVHLANIAARTRGVLDFDPQQERVTNNESADKLVGRAYRKGHWAVPGGSA